MSVGMPRPLSATVISLFAWIVTSMRSHVPFIASSIELSRTSRTRWCRPRRSVVPMYMPGRRRTASRPSRTWMSFALYDAGTFVPLPSPRAVFTSSFLTATCSPLCLSGANEHLAETLEVFVVVELDLDATAATPAKDLHLRAQRGTELVRHLRKVGIATQHARARASAPSGWVDHLAHQRLRVAHRKLAGQDLAERGDGIRKW